MRRRNVHSTGMDPDDDPSLQQPLLAHDDEEEKGHEAGRRPGNQVILYPGPFNLKAFIIHILEKCAQQVYQAGLYIQEGLLSTLGKWFGWKPYSNEPLNTVQEERLNTLWHALNAGFDPHLPEHEQALKNLWTLAFPDLPYTGLKSEQWKEMGWQGVDPTTDIRGAGLFGVENLLYLARTYPGEWDRLLHKRTGKRADWEYPFAAAGLNLTMLLTEILGMRHGLVSTAEIAALRTMSMPAPIEQMRKQPTFTGFVRLLAQDPACFQELYCTAFVLLDAQWLDTGASYMQFNSVLKDIREKLIIGIKSKPRSMQDLRDQLGVTLLK